MIVTLLAFAVGGHTFAVPASLTAVSNLEFAADLRDRSGARGIGRVASANAGAGAQGLVQCSPDAGANWYTMATISLGSTGDKTTSLQAGATDYQSIPSQCRTDVRLRAALQGGNGGNVVVTYLGIEVR